MLDGESMVRTWSFEQLLEVVRGALDGLSTPLRSAAAMSEPSRHCLFFFLLGRLEAPSLASSSCFTLPLRRLKIAPPASSSEAWLTAMSRSSLVVHGPLHPSL